MKIFEFVKKVFFIGLTVLSDFIKTSSLSCISLINQELLMLMGMNLCFFHLVLKQVNVVVALIILTIHMQKFVFLML